MNTPFGPAWEDLKLMNVRAFFGGRHHENQLWEAKGVDPRLHRAGFRPEEIRESVCGFANTPFGGSHISGSTICDMRSRP